MSIGFTSLVDHGIPQTKLDRFVSELRRIPGAEDPLVGIEAAQYRRWPRFPTDEFFAGAGKTEAFLQTMARFVGSSEPDS